jgi:DOPA 4,5-dioxygenase
MQTPPEEFTNFHAHIYFNPDEVDQARVIGEAAAALFGAEVGRYHVMPIGPHPRGSCQLTVAKDRFGELAQWLTFNRRGLTIFAHALTRQALADHTDHVIWFGPSETLNLEMFMKAPQS